MSDSKQLNIQHRVIISVSVTVYGFCLYCMVASCIVLL